MTLLYKKDGTRINVTHSVDVRDLIASKEFAFEPFAEEIEPEVQVKEKKSKKKVLKDVHSD